MSGWLHEPAALRLDSGQRSAPCGVSPRWRPWSRL